MQVELSKEELAIVLDGLAALPLARTYNLFNRLLPYLNAEIPQAATVTPLTTGEQPQ